MKKRISFLLAFAMLFSLCACGSGESSTNSNPTTAPEETKALSETAVAFDYDVFCDAVESNMLKAKETYEGNAYFISAFVREITQTDCMLAFYDTYDTDYRLRVQFDKEILMELETYQRINIVGRIDEISLGFVYINEAEYLGNTTQLPATVLSVTYTPDLQKPSYCVARITDFVDHHISLYCIVRLSEDVLYTLNKEDEITVEGVLYTRTYDYNNIHMYDGTKVTLELQDAELAD